MPDIDSLLQDTLAEARSLDSGDGDLAWSRTRRRARIHRIVRTGVGGGALAVLAAGLFALASVDNDSTLVALPGESGQPPTTSMAPASTSTTTSTSTTAPDRSVGAEKEEATPTSETTPPDRQPSSTTTPTTTDTTEPSRRQGPPAAWVGTRDGEVRAVQGSYCWRDADASAGLCADTTSEYANDAPTVTVPTGGGVVVRYETSEQPRDLNGYATDSSGRMHREFSTKPGNPGGIVIDLPPGDYVLHISSLWRQGDVTHGVRLHVTD